MDVRQRLTLLSHCRGIGRQTIRKFLLNDPQLLQIFNLSKTELTHVFYLTSQQSDIFLHDLHTLDIDKIMNHYQQQNINILTIFDDSYPIRLAETADPPLVLFYKGKRSLLNREKMISVVGTREPTTECSMIMNRILEPIVREGWTIVSGLAKGVDTLAHELGLRHSTIAILGSGFDHVYPTSNLYMFRKIVTNHLVVSEYPPYQKPQKYQFPERNRIISGLSWGTLVVEAKKRSGSLITADQALEEGREVFAVPGSILQEKSDGTNALIQQGAKLVLSSEDILSEWKTIAKI